MPRTKLDFDLSTTGGKKLLREFNELDTRIKSTTTNIARLKSELQILSQGTFSKQGNQIARLATGTNSYSKAIKVLNNDLVRQQTEEQRLRQIQAAKLAQNKRVDTSLTGLANRVERLALAYSRLNAQERASDAGKKLLSDINTAQRQAAQAQRGLDSALGRGRSSSLFGGGAALLGQIAQYQLLSAAIQQVAQVMVSTVTTVVEFDSAQKNLQGILNISAETMTGLTDEAIRLGQSTAFTATQVTELQTELAKLGFTKGEIQAAGAAVVDFAVATRTAVPRAAQVAGATLRSFNLDATEMRRVLDVLTKSTTISALSFEKLEKELPIVSAAADSVNVDLEETVAILAVLADRGVQASTAATSLRNIFIESEKRGFTDYREALEQISTATDKISTAFELFGKRGAVQAVILADNIGEVADKERVLTEESENAAKALADIQLQSIAGRVTLLTSAWSGLILAIDKGNGSLSTTTKLLTDEVTQSLNLLTASLERGEVSVLSFFQNIAGGAAGNAGANALSRNLDIADQAIQGYIQSVQEITQLQFVRGNVESEIITELTKLYQQAGFDREQAERKATQFLEDELARREEAVRKSNLRNLQEQITLEDLLGIDVNSLQTLRSLTELEQELSGIRQTAIIGTEKFTQVEGKLAEVRARLAKINKDGVGVAGKEQIENIAFYTAEINKLFNSLQLIDNEDVRAKVLLDIQEAEDKIEELRSNIQEAVNTATQTNTALSDKVAKEAFELEKQRLTDIYETRENNLKLTEQDESILSAKLKELDLERQIVLLQYQEQLAVGDQERISALQQQIALLNQQAGTASTSTGVVTDVADIRESFVVQRAEILLTAKTQEERIQRLAELEMRLDIEVKQAELVLLKRNSEEEQKALSEIGELRRRQQEEFARVNLTNFTSLDGNDIQRLQELIKLQDQLISNEITYGEFKQKSQDIEDTLNADRLNSEIQVAAAILAVRVRNNEATKEDVERLYQAQSELNNLQVEDAKRAAKEVEKVNRRLVQQTLKSARKVGDALGSVLSAVLSESEDAVGDTLKVLANQTIDFLTNVVEAKVVAAIAETSIEAGKSIATLDLTAIARITAAVATIRAASALFKSQIARLFEEGGPLGESAESMYAERGIRIKSGKRGHLVRGRRHSQGGVKFLHNGTIHEYEDGEIVINRKSAQKFRKELSQINSYKGWGRRFQDGGTLSAAPQLTSPFQSQVIDYDKLANTIAERVTNGQLEVIRESNSTLVEAMATAITTTNRFNDRAKLSEQKAKI